MTNKLTAKKIILSMIFLVGVSAITFYSIFKEISLKGIIEDIETINYSFTFICTILVLLYFTLHGYYKKEMLNSLNCNTSLKKGMFYSVIEFFFSGITPSSTGGQPVELIYMSKDKIPVRKSIIVLVLNTIFFKIFMLFFGLIILLFRRNLIFGNGPVFTTLFFIGFTGDFLMIIACLVLSFKQEFVKKIVRLYFKITKKKSKKDEKKIDEIVKKYQDEVEYVKTHKKDVIKGLVITFIQRICLFSITYVIFKAFHLKGYNYYELLTMQIAVHMCIEFIPLPGGAGISEYLFNHLFLNIFGTELATVAMALTRIYTFYLPLLIIMVIIIINTVRKTTEK